MAVNEAQAVDIPTVDPGVLARHLAWQRSMQLAVACEFDEHRAQGDTVVIMSEGKIVSLGPGQY